MNRRTFLAAGVSGVAFTFSGCAEVQSLVGEGSKPLGEAVVHDGVEVTVDDYVSATTVGFENSTNGYVLEKTAPDGATYLLTHMTVRHVGENEREFPVRGISRPRQDQIKMTYNGESLHSPREEETSVRMHTEGEQYPCYIPNVPRQPVYEGSASGWLCNEITAEFDLADLTCEVSWGGSSTTWVYSSEQ